MKFSSRFARYRQSMLLRAFSLLQASDRKRTIPVIGIQLLLAVLDLIGVGIVGILGALTIASVSNEQPGDRVSMILNFLRLSNISLRNQAIILGTLSACLLLGKSLLSMYTLRRLSRHLARQSARISSELIHAVFAFPFLRLKRQSIMAWRFQLTYAVDTVSIGILTALLLMVSDIILVIILGLGIFLVEPLIAFGTLLMFSLSALTIYKLQHAKFQSIGLETSKINVLTDEAIYLMLESYRDLFVRSSLSTYADRIKILRLKNADLNAARTYLPYIGKFGIELTTVIGFLLIAGSQFLLNDASRAVGNIAVFFVASARISPAVLRIQQGLLAIKGNRGSAESALDLIDEILQSKIEPLTKRSVLELSDHKNDTPCYVRLDSVSFQYPGNSHFKISNFSCEIKSGESVGIVGPSGSGKSTLADLILGIITPTLGTVLVDGKTPQNLHSLTPGKMAYVPQKIVVTNQTIKENIAIGLDVDSITEEDYWDALMKAEMSDFVHSLPKKLETKLGVGGIELSGGQSQRLGLARALVTSPNVLLLDEATSSLDGKTEFLITKSLQDLKGYLTLVVIAHRLSTIKNMDKVIYIVDGKIRAIGTFSNLISQFPDFAEQAELMQI